MVGEGVQVLCGGPCGKFSKLDARSGPCTMSAHLIPSRSDVLGNVIYPCVLVTIVTIKNLTSMLSKRTKVN